MEIRKGQRSALTQILQNTNPIFQIELSISGVDVDFSCFGLNTNDKLFNDDYMMFFNQPQTPCAAVLLTTETSSAIFSCDLSKLPESVEKLSFTAAIDGQETMQQIQSGHLKFLVDGQEVACFNFDGSDFDSEKSLMLGDVYRKNGEWRFSAVAQGFHGGLESLVSYFSSVVIEKETTVQTSQIESKTKANVVNDESTESENLGESDYTLFAEEIKRLCQVEKQLFQEVLQLPHVFDYSDPEKPDPKIKFENDIKNIDNEIQKLEKMEVVIAVVGTMKAGKSTTINAIVGTEVLPNRNAPMTTLPTLIRNVHGQTEPVLKLNKLQPLENLSKQIVTKLAALVTSNEIGQIDLYNSQDGKELIDDLLKNQRYQFQTEYKGQQAIFSFLKHLNDLMRLAKEDFIQVEPPYAEYENLNDLPVIEIEFFHLKGKEKNAQGSLAILDTPGPNEFGQSEALREVFKKQLAKASAVALVVDYTQMNSQAGGDVVEQVENVTNQLSKNNLYVLVNKFDQANANSMKTKEEVQSYVVKTLMDNAIEKTQVYPISSQHAYLANRAKHNLELHGKLPNFENEGWVKDFGDEAMGKRWEKKIDDLEEVLECANELWNDSLFDEPLNGIIHKAHATAAQESVKSAILKLVRWHDELTNNCQAFSGAVSKNLTTVTEAIKSLQNNINQLQQVKKNIHDATENGVDELSVTLNKLADQNQKRLKDEIEILFKEGKARETSQNAKELQLLIEKEKEKKFGSFADIFLTWGRSYTNSQSENLKRKMAFSASNPVIIFKDWDRDGAEQLNRNIQKSVVEIFDNLSKQFKEHSGLITSKMADEISEKISEFTKIALIDAQEKLKESSGFQLNFSLPKLELDLNSFDASSAFVSGVDKKSEQKTGSRVTNSFTNWFNSSWGRESYTYTETSYIVDTNKIRQSILAHLETYKTSYTNQFKEHLERKLKPAIDKHTKSLEDYLARYQDTFLTVEKANKSMEQADKEQLLKQLDLLMGKGKIQTGDIDVIKICLEAQA